MSQGYRLRTQLLQKLCQALLRALELKFDHLSFPQ